MATITREDFERRHAELQDALRLADDAYSQACFALETETGTAEDADKAARHRDAIKARLQGLTAAFQQSNVEAERQREKEKVAAHRKLVKVIGAELASRETALQVAVGAAETLANSMRSHDEGRERIRALVNDYRRHHDTSVEPGGIVSVLGNCQFIPGVVGAVLAGAGVQPSLINGSPGDIAARPPQDREEYDSERIANFVANLLPAEVEPA